MSGFAADMGRLAVGSLGSAAAAAAASLAYGLLV
jgi:hypothetical protein